MKKSELLKQNSELYHQLDEALKKLNELEKKFETVNKELEAEKSANEQLRTKTDAISAIEPEQSEKAVSTDGAETAPVFFNPESPKAPEGFGLFEKEDNAPQITLEDDLQYAADVIGQLVIESAKCSNTLTEGGNTKYIELVNLILGKTEVSKAEILGIAKQDLPIEVKKQKIDGVKAATLEYFESVMAQR